MSYVTEKPMHFAENQLIFRQVNIKSILALVDSPQADYVLLLVHILDVTFVNERH